MTLKITMPGVLEKKEVEIGDYFHNTRTQSFCRIIKQRDNTVCLVDIINAEIIKWYDNLSNFKRTFVDIASDAWVHYKSEEFELMKKEK